DSLQHLQSVRHRIHHTSNRGWRETPCPRDKGIIGCHQHLNAAALSTREMQRIQVAQAVQAQGPSALHGSLVTGHTLSGTSTQGQDCCAPTLLRTLAELVEQCIGSDPKEYACLYGTQQIFYGFCLESDTGLTLVVKRPIQITGIEIDTGGHTYPFIPEC